MKIYASKNLGKLYYLVKDADVIETIVREGRIKVTDVPEKGYSGGGKHNFVSLLRSLDHAGRNSSKWVYGIQLDGTALSDRYKIVSYSSAGIGFKGKSSAFRVNYLAEYDNGDLVLKIASRPAIKIPQYVYDEIEQAIINNADGANDLNRLEIGHNLSKRNGRAAVTRYLYRVQHGGLRLNEATLSPSAIAYLSKHTCMNETEERIWVIDENVQYINIKGLVTGYAEPEGDDTIENMIENKLIPKKNILHYRPW